MGWRENASSSIHLLKMLTQRHREFPRAALVRLNCLQNDVGLFVSETHKWGMASMAARDCGAKDQIAEYVLIFCPIYHHSNGARGPSDANRNRATWLKEHIR